MDEGWIDCQRLMRKGRGGAGGPRWHVLYGKTGKSRHLDASVEGATRDFMSRNSLGSPTFMFYPVIMMSTYTLDKTKHYPTSFLPFRPLPSHLLAEGPVLVDVFVPGNRNSFATRKCLAFLRPAQVLRTVGVILSPLFPAWNAYRYDTPRLRRTRRIHGDRRLRSGG